MYKPKPVAPCDMPAPGTRLQALVLNASLKPAPDISNTQELSDLVLENMTTEGVRGEIVRLADARLPVGLGFREGPDDDWPGIVTKLKAADIVLFATPIWWGGRSSLMQRVIERMDALDEEYRADGRSALYNKVAGVVVTGNEDGAHASAETTLFNMTHLGCVVPPNADCYWVGDAGPGPSYLDAGGEDHPYTQKTASWSAHNMLHMARILRDNPIPPIGNTVESMGGDTVHGG